MALVVPADAYVAQVIGSENGSAARVSAYTQARHDCAVALGQALG